MRRSLHPSRQHALNPFVVLSDVTIAVILILLFYFSAVLLYQLNEAQHLRAQVSVGQQELENKKRRLEEQEQELARRTRELQETERKLVDFTAAKERDLLRDRYLDEVRKVAAVSSLKGKVKARAPEGDVQVFSLGADVLFETGEHTLKNDGRALLKEFGGVLATKLADLQRENGFRYVYPEIQVQGHTDTERADNWELSVQRALEVVRVFGKQQRLRSSHLSAAGYSCHRPQKETPPDTKAPENRRIEVRLVFARDESPGEFKAGEPSACDCDLYPGPQPVRKTAPWRGGWTR
jgi:flagellar motor protein MotB